MGLQGADGVVLCDADVPHVELGVRRGSGSGIAQGALRVTPEAAASAGCCHGGEDKLASTSVLTKSSHADEVRNVSRRERASVHGNDRIADASGELHPPCAVHHALVVPRGALACWDHSLTSERSARGRREMPDGGGCGMPFGIRWPSLYVINDRSWGIRQALGEGNRRVNSGAGCSTRKELANRSPSGALTLAAYSSNALTSESTAKVGGRATEPSTVRGH